MKLLDVYLFEALVTKAQGTSSYCKTNYKNYTEPIQIGGFLIDLRSLLKENLELSLDEIAMINEKEQTGIILNIATYPELAKEDETNGILMYNLVCLSEIEKKDKTYLSRIKWDSVHSIMANYSYKMSLHKKISTIGLDEKIINNVSCNPIEYNIFEKKILIQEYNGNIDINVYGDLHKDFAFMQGKRTSDKEGQKLVALIGFGLCELEKMIKYYKNKEPAFAPELIMCTLNSRQNNYVLFIKKDVEIKTLITLASKEKSAPAQKDAVKKFCKNL